MIRIAIIGCGGIADYHGPQLAKLPNVNVVGTCDVLEQKARGLAEKLGVGKWCTDYRELLDGVDAVWVCTPPFARVDIITAAADAGKHIFSEKPIALNLKDADTMIAAAKKAKVKYMLGYCFRFWNPYKLLHDTFASGELGELVSCWGRRYESCDMRGTWFGDQEKSGGVMLDNASHLVDWVRWVGGDVKTVFAKTFRIHPNSQADDHGGVLLFFENGGMGAVEQSLSSWVTENTIGLVGTKGGMIVSRDGVVRRRIGAEGTEQIVDVEAGVDVDSSGHSRKKDDSGKSQSVARHRESIHEHFFRCIEQDVEPVTSAIEARKTLQTVLALLRSARTGRSVELSEVN
jgi:predicted dehydrogenase